MVESISRIAFLLLLIVAYTVSAEAQITGTIIGQVVDSMGAPIIYGTVQVETTNRGGLAKDPDGRFTIAAIRAGTYTLTVRAAGYHQVQLTANVIVDSIVNVGVVRLLRKAVPQEEWRRDPRREPSREELPRIIWREVPLIQRATMLRRGAVGTTRIISRDDLWLW